MGVLEIKIKDSGERHEKQRWTKEEEESILLDMRKNGNTYREIGKALGRSIKSCQAGYRKLSLSEKKNQKNEELAGQILSLMEQGYIAKEMADMLGVPMYRIVEVKKMYGIRLGTIDKIRIARRIVEIKKKEPIPDKETICWTCSKAGRGCEKPVKGFVATKIPYGNYSPQRFSYIVKKCPNYEIEPWLEKENQK